MQIFTQGIANIADPFLHADYVSSGPMGFLYPPTGCFLLIGLLLFITIIIIVLSCWRRKKKKAKVKNDRARETGAPTHSSPKTGNNENDPI